MPRRRKRLDPAAFSLPIEQIRAGFFSDRSSAAVGAVLAAEGKNPRVVLQVTTRQEGYLSGIDEAVAILKLCSGDWSQLTVHALAEGDAVDAWETVMTVEGPYAAFAHLDTLCVGVLSRRTQICTIARQAVDAARPKQIIFLGGSDFFLTQAGDGYAAYAGGATTMGSDALASLFGGTTLSAVSHGLIAACRGDAVRAARALADRSDGGKTRILGVADYDNDCVKTSLELARALEERLWGVMLDTPETMVDRSVIPQMGTMQPNGVTPQLVWNVRNALDGEGFGDVQIVVSGGFDTERIRLFEDEGAAVDAYCLGSGTMRGARDFTADIVRVDGKPQSRAGRAERGNPKLLKVT